MNLRLYKILFAGLLVLVCIGPPCANAAIPLKRIILDGKVVAGKDQTPVNRVWVGLFAGEKPLGYEWTRADGSFHFKNPLNPGVYWIKLRPANRIFKDATAEIDLPRLAPGETEETLLMANRFMSARGILEQPINQDIINAAAAKTGRDKKTVTDVMTALIDAVNEFYFPEHKILTLEKVEEVPLRTVTLRGSVKGLLGRGRLRGGIARFLWKHYEIATVPTDSEHRFVLESVQVPVGKIAVIAGDRFGLFQRVEQEFAVTPETTVIRFDNLVCHLRTWVKVAGALILVGILWLVIQGHRVFRRVRATDAAAPVAPSSAPPPPLLSIGLWWKRLQPAPDRVRALWGRVWGHAPRETQETVVVSAWFWMHGGLSLFLVLWVALQLYGHTIRASGPLTQPEAIAISHAQQLRAAVAGDDDGLYEKALQVNADFTPFQIFVWSQVLKISIFNQTAWQCAQLILLCLSALLVGFGDWALSQRVFRFSAGGSVAGLCATALILLCPVAVRYSCTLYPETGSLFLVSASLAVWCFVGVTPVRPTLAVCSLLLGTTFLYHPMHGLLITVVLLSGTLLRKGGIKKRLTNLICLLLPGVASVAIFSRILLPNTSDRMYAFLARGEGLGAFQGLLWSFKRLLVDYSPYSEAMWAILLSIVAVTWVSRDQRVRGLVLGLVAGLFFIALYTGKYYSSLLALIPVIVLFPALAIEAAVSHVESQRRKPYAMTIATLALLLAPFGVNRYSQLYQRPYYQTTREWNPVLDKLLPTIDPIRGALIIGENSDLCPEAVNVSLVERYEANLKTIYRPDFQGTITPSGDYIPDVTQTSNEVQRWLQNKLVGSVSVVELLPGNPLLKQKTFMRQEGWSQTWARLLKKQPWYPETRRVNLDSDKVAIHVYRQSIPQSHIGRSRRIDSPYAGITRLALLDDQGRYATHVEPGFPMAVRAKVVNLLDSELRASLWWVLSDRFVERPWKNPRSETKESIVLPPNGQDEFSSTLAMPGESGRYWLSVYLQAENGTHLDAAFLADDVRVKGFL